MVNDHEFKVKTNQGQLHCGSGVGTDLDLIIL